MSALEIASVELLSAPADPASGECEVRVSFVRGGCSTFRAATFDRPAAWLAASKASAAWTPPVLFVRRLDEDGVRAAVAAMAADIGGYWLRYYNTPRAS
jgi:hypothetical protein